MKDLTSSVSTFVDMIQGNFLYVDKTQYLWQLIRPAKAMYFLARPRRFGKSLTVSTLKAIFQGKKELFQGLALFDKPYDWKKYPVIHLDMNGRDFSDVAALRHSLSNIIAEQARALKVSLKMDEPTTMFQRLIETLSTSSPVVVLLDEYDKPILNNITEPDNNEILKVLKAFYSVIKEKSGNIRFAFVTGVTKFCHVSLFSDLNNLTDISMDGEYATMLGYTQTEFETYFEDWIAELQTRQGLSRPGYLAEIKKWYDGYRFAENSETVYNPVSLANFFNKRGAFHNYWFATGTPTFLMDLIKRNQLDLEQVTTEPATAYAFGAFELDTIPPLTLLLQTGYLTIKSSENRFGTTLYHLDFPNREVSESFNVHLLNAYAKRSQNEVANFCIHLSEAMVNGDLPKFQKALEIFFAGIPYDVPHHNEANFQNIFFAIFKLLGYNIHAESRTSDGRIDAVIETAEHIYLFEFKLNRDDSALTQIQKKAYFKQYLLSPKQITLVGANFDTGTGRISGWQNQNVVR